VSAARIEVDLMMDYPGCAASEVALAQGRQHFTACKHSGEARLNLLPQKVNAAVVTARLIHYASCRRSFGT
jgi:hypothetical protein